MTTHISSAPLTVFDILFTRLAIAQRVLEKGCTVAHQ